MEVGYEEIIVTVGNAERYTFVHSPLAAVVDGFDGVRRIHGRVPPRNRAVFADKDEDGRPRNSILSDLEGGGVVKDRAGWIGAISVARGVWDLDHQRNHCAILIVQC